MTYTFTTIDLFLLISFTFSYALLGALLPRWQNETPKIEALEFELCHATSAYEEAIKRATTIFEHCVMISQTNRENEQRADLANARADRAEAALARVEAEIAKSGTKPRSTNADLIAASRAASSNSYAATDTKPVSTLSDSLQSMAEASTSEFQRLLSNAMSNGVTVDLVKSILPKTLPHYITEFKYDVTRDSARGNMGGAFFAEFFYKVDGRGMVITYTLSDFIKIITRGSDHYWNDYFEAIGATNACDEGDQS